MATDKQKESDVINSLVRWLKGEAEDGNQYTKEELYEKAKKFANLFGFHGKLDNIVLEAELSITTTMGNGVTLFDENANHDKDWVYKKNHDFNWTHSNAYEKYLEDDNWPKQVINKINESGKRILGYLQDPESGGKWDRRGLVIGEVQSGKTSNFMGVINRAADAKYRLIIVIAGLSNELRKQTQERIDKAFIGRSSDPNSRRERIGVGKDDPDFPTPVTLTNINSDFNKSIAKSLGGTIDNFNRPVVVVIKKHTTVLETLYDWLKDLNAEQHGHITDIPMLMIDDEADQASINYNKEEIDPTKTNSWIRKILSLFDKSSFIAYTATPFANIFINPDDYSEDAMEELFPRDFIHCLDAPNTYFGPEKVFSQEDGYNETVREINDAENSIPLGHKNGHLIKELPKSMKEAFIVFILSRAIRNLRGQENKHASMMIHASRFTNVQSQIKDYIVDYQREISDAIKANYKMHESISSQNLFMKDIKKNFNSNYSNSEFTWEQIKETLFSVFDHMRIYEINGTSGDSLDFSEYEKDGLGLTAIAIGGNSLSRGLTIEGLTVSYFYRNTRMYDTLMQMGRWFGYRPGYEDLCRVYLARASRDWYSYIAEATLQLRSQIAKMQQDGLSPKDFGLYVKDHPDKVLITARNKMRSAEKRGVKMNFSGSIKETVILPIDVRTNDINYKQIQAQLKSGFSLGNEAIIKNTKGWHINNVPSEDIINFLKEFKVHPVCEHNKAAIIKYYQKMAKEYSTSDVSFISSNEKDGIFNKEFDLRRQRRSTGEFRKIDPNTEVYYKLSRNRLASKGDEKHGLTNTQIDEAKNLHQKECPEKSMSDNYYRRVRNKPLLMLHHLELKERNQKIYTAESVSGFGVSFPYGHYEKPVEVVVNKVWMDIMHGNDFYE